MANDFITIDGERFVTYDFEQRCDEFEIATNILMVNGERKNYTGTLTAFNISAEFHAVIVDGIVKYSYLNRLHYAL